MEKICHVEFKFISLKSGIYLFIFFLQMILSVTEKGHTDLETDDNSEREKKKRHQHAKKTILSEDESDDEDDLGPPIPKRKAGAGREILGGIENGPLNLQDFYLDL